MKIRSETITLLRLLAAEDLPVTDRYLAHKIDGTYNDMRARTKRLLRAGLVGMELRYHICHECGTRRKLPHYWISAQGRQELEKRNDQPQPSAAPKRRHRSVVNSVFALGSNALQANLT